MNSKEKQIKTSENNYKMTKLDKTKQESFEKKRNTSKTKLSKEISKQSRNNSVIIINKIGFSKVFQISN